MSTAFDTIRHERRKGCTGLHIDTDHREAKAKRQREQHQCEIFGRIGELVETVD